MNMIPGQRILFVDDEQAILDAMKRLLRARKANWQPYFASGVEAALTQMAVTSFDAVVSDIKMPGRDGFDLLQTIRATDQFCDIPVVMVTGLGERDLKRKALELGATDLLSKPVDNDELLARLASVLQLKAYQDRIKAQNEILEQKVLERTLDLEDARIDLIWRLAKAGEHRDSETGNHVLRVGYFCRAIAQSIGMDTHFSELIFLTSPLHDLGKIGIPDAILLKQGRLSEQEFDVMRGHCQIGAELLSPDNKGRLLSSTLFGRRGHAEPGDKINPFLDMASSIASAHHERWKGTGYPRGLTGKQIPLEARIITIADVYDALHSKRPYKPAFNEEKARAIMDEMAGEYFDPELYDNFLHIQKQLREIRLELVDNEHDEEQSFREKGLL
ncbi:MAG: response regulator [Desulfobulbaceae bacterium]|nr:response regulator [Desulfobulbaceae bacterium]